ncbi:carph-isopro domain-containing protein [Rhizobium alvei]|uniref:Uncharacterized protein n=1 Tax=Rhizobium alvei TaxID=1132659 RepID=A0ABT8YTA2_9HYPH|nr:hypothetical protein [Rhizobium alvei]MDO6966948.1 hypothetical protein [Rhizobium alvei]
MNMITEIETVDDIVSVLGGNASMARVICKGPSAVSEMKRRDSIPVEYWPAIVAECATLGRDDITLEAIATVMANAAMRRRGGREKLRHDVFRETAQEGV